MKSHARIGDHPLHPLLIVIPAGTFVAALAFDVVYLLSDNPIWWQGTKPLMLVGVIGALIAAVPGLIDLIGVVPKQGATRIGVTHMVLMLIAVALFAWNDYLRWDAAAPPPPTRTYLGFWLSLVAVVLLGIAGWLGGKMVFEYHVAVLEHPEAKDPWPGPVQQAAD
ncbi:MAG TPA: DUF2231 domain-containing protein [Longimicrobiales bacterium]|nr:DUF2231 domain-containing protein [Longimicrobiales bacterium]